MAQAAAIDVDERSSATIAGLTSAEARQRRNEFGPNAVSEHAPPRWRVFLAKFWAPIPWMLEAAIVLQIGLGDYVEAAVIGALLLFNARWFLPGRPGGRSARRAKEEAGANRAGPPRRSVDQASGSGAGARRCRSGCRSARWCRPMLLSRRDR